MSNATPIYSIGFSQQLIEAASLLIKKDAGTGDTARAINYMSKVASEIALKALLEKAGMPLKEIRARSHDLDGLLVDIGKCKVEAKDIDGSVKLVWATRIRAVNVDEKYPFATIGRILSAEKDGASKYPNEIRYGYILTDYSPDIVLKTAAAVIKWATEHLDSIHLPNNEKTPIRGKPNP